MGSVLIVEDQAPVRYALRVLFESHGMRVAEATNADEAERAVKSSDVDVVVQDMNFAIGATSGDEGIALFRALRAHDAELPVILMTAWASLETAVLLAKEGATDYIAKPWSDEKLVATVRMHVAARTRRGRKDESLGAEVDTCGAVFRSAASRRLLSLAVQVAREPIPVLILGPNGAGKERVAEVIQRNSNRRDKPFLKVNAGGLPDSLLEAELFGAEAGAFTGATKARAGRFEEADGGTLFLDEIGNLSLAGQMRLLRVLQTGEFERLGSARTRRVDIRLITATNLDVYAAVRAGSFREDLLYRINVFELRVPPLCERVDDIIPLAESILRELADERGSEPRRLSDDAKRALRAYRWPGNVRELRNSLTRAMVLAPDRTIGAADFAIEPSAPASNRSLPSPLKTIPSRDELEAALARHGGNVRSVAAELGLSRQALYRRMEKLGLDVERFRNSEDDGP